MTRIKIALVLALAFGTTAFGGGARADGPGPVRLPSGDALQRAIELRNAQRRAARARQLADRQAERDMVDGFLGAITGRSAPRPSPSPRALPRPAREQSGRLSTLEQFQLQLLLNGMKAISRPDSPATTSAQPTRGTTGQGIPGRTLPSAPPARPSPAPSPSSSHNPGGVSPALQRARQATGF